MPSSRHRIVKHVFRDIFGRLNRTKQLNSGDGTIPDTSLKRCLSTFDITFLGVGHMLGAGIYVLTGSVAKQLGGPALIISFILAGIASTLAALCYAEFGTRIPKAGSAYVYTYVSVGEFWAFVIGWNIVLEHMIGAASVARAWSGYLDILVDGSLSKVSSELLPEIESNWFSDHPDIFAFVICVMYSFTLTVGVKGSAIINLLMTAANLGVIFLVVGAGFRYGSFSNWSSQNEETSQFDFAGIMAGAATCFYAYIGFDCIATSGEEAINPVKSIPTATISAMSIVCLVYVMVSAALTLMVPHWEINANAALPSAFMAAGLPSVSYLIMIGAVCGVTTSMLGSLFALPRCLYAMAQDGLIFEVFAKIDPAIHLPLANMMISSITCGLIALLFDLETLVEFMSIGTLLAYTIVSASVIILRYRPIPMRPPVLATPTVRVRPMKGRETTSEVVGPPTIGGGLKARFFWLHPLLGDLKPGKAVSLAVFVYCGICTVFCVNVYSLMKVRNDMINASLSFANLFFSIVGLVLCLLIMEAHEQTTIGLTFRVPFVPYLPAVSILCNIVLISNLNVFTWMRFVCWMALGLLVYFGYGIRHSKLNNGETGYAALLSFNRQARYDNSSADADESDDEDDDKSPIIGREHARARQTPKLAAQP